MVLQLLWAVDGQQSMKYTNRGGWVTLILNCVLTGTNLCTKQRMFFFWTLRLNLIASVWSGFLTLRVWLCNNVNIYIASSLLICLCIISSVQLRISTISTLTKVTKRNTKWIKVVFYLTWFVQTIAFPGTLRHITEVLCISIVPWTKVCNGHERLTLEINNRFLLAYPNLLGTQRLCCDCCIGCLNLSCWQSNRWIFSQQKHGFWRTRSSRER